MSPEQDAAERLQAALDALAAGRPRTEVMAGLPPELQPLLETISLLSASRQAGELPSAGFVLGLEEQLRADLRLRPMPAAPVASDGIFAGGLVRIVGLVLITLGLAGGILLGSADRAMPGQALYPFKRGMEEARRVLQGDPAEAAAAGLDRGWQRLIEAERLLEETAPDLQRLEQLLDEMAACYAEALDLAARADAPAIALRAEGESLVAELRLEQLLSSAPAELRPRIRRVRDGLLAARQRLLATGPVPLVPIVGGGGALAKPPVGLTPLSGSPTAVSSPAATQVASTAEPTDGPTATLPAPTEPVAPSASPTADTPATAPARASEAPRPTATRRSVTEEPAPTVTPERTALAPTAIRPTDTPAAPPTREPEPTWTPEPRWPTETPEPKPIEPTPDPTSDGHRVPAAD